MKILIDTNIFYNNWYLDNAYFEYLFNFIENTNSELFISEVVIEEVEEKFNQQISTLRQGFKKNVQLSEKLLNKKIHINLNEILVEFSFKEILKSKSDNIVFFGYENVSNKTLVQRAVNVVKPFSENDKGFRDSLIWLSFLNYIKSNQSNDEIVMINNNSSDFMNKEKNGLDKQLLEDLLANQIKNDFLVFISLKHFIDEKVDIYEHKYTGDKALEKLIYENEGEIEENILEHINNQQPSWFQNLLSKSNSELADIKYLIDYKFIIEEGIEDPELIKWSYVDDKKIFVELSLNLRIVDLHLTFPIQVYKDSMEKFNSNSYNVLEHGDFVTLYMIKKINLDIAFNVVGELFVDNIVINSFTTN